MKRQGFRILAMTVLLALCFCLVPQGVFARTASEVQQEINEQRKVLESIAAQIQANKNDIAAAQAALAEYEARHNEMLALIEEQAALIANTQADLDAKTAQLADTIESIQHNRTMFEERLVSIYKNNTNNSLLSAVLSVEDFAQFMVMTDSLQRISKHDTDLLNRLAEEKAQYEKQKAELETSIENLNAEMEQLEANRDWAAAKMLEARNMIASAEINIRNAEEERTATQDEIRALQAEYNRIFNEAASRGSSANDGSIRYDGPLAWPASGRLTSYFGDPRSNTGYHYGIDIANGIGTTITAAADGTVLTSAWNGSYGNYIIIDHGGGLRTLYAHCNQLIVGAGEFVFAQQPIAYMGNTGNSFGSHLHFEVHDHGARQNPLGSGYLNP